uniref:NADH-ubiquinone oxidoreductase chain 4 n=1 Tax=Opilio parietinus TaxID=121214 RepID=E3UHH4_9ARAC|nr:NADH dehydrogenase subunit 4 [Opilio parietinus]ADI92919.1 NADH dehydrogenase subunit 4 [Opilio parietinus]
MLGFLLFNFSLILLSSQLTFFVLCSFVCLSMVIWALKFPLSEGVNHLSLVFGYDILGYILVFLTLWIVYLGLLSSGILFREKINFSPFIFLSLLLLLTLLVTFLTYDALMFYFSFEASLIPLLLLIVGYGAQPEKLRAGLYMLFYTMFGSLPLLLGLFFSLNFLHSLNFFYFSLCPYELPYILFFFINGAFFIKLPGYLVHLWLPKAHVEAPVFGSMILAGVMLSMGGYGMLRFIPLFLSYLILYGDLILSFFLGGGVIMSIVCLSQSDMKGLVAYSSVGHMSMFLGGVFSLSIYGYMGALVIMLAHGFTSSGLFSIVNMVYERLHTRSLLMIRGLMMLFPGLSLLWFILSVSNMAAPPFLNLLGELFLSFGIVSVSLFYMVPLGLMFFLAGCYSLYLFSISQHGKVWVFSTSPPLSVKECLILWGHIYPLLLIVLNLSLIF